MQARGRSAILTWSWSHVVILQRPTYPSLKLSYDITLYLPLTHNKDVKE